MRTTELRQRSFDVNSNTVPECTVSFFELNPQYRYPRSIYGCWQIHVLIFAKCIIWQSLHGKIKILTCVKCTRNPRKWSDEWLPVHTSDVKKFHLDDTDAWFGTVRGLFGNELGNLLVDNKKMVHSWSGQHFLIIEISILLFGNVISITKITRKEVQLLPFGKLLGWEQMDVLAKPLIQSRIQLCNAVV